MALIEMDTPGGGRVSFRAEEVIGMTPADDGTWVHLRTGSVMNPVRGTFGYRPSRGVEPGILLVAERSLPAIEERLRLAKREEDS